MANKAWRWNIGCPCCQGAINVRKLSPNGELIWSIAAVLDTATDITIDEASDGLFVASTDESQSVALQRLSTSDGESEWQHVIDESIGAPCVAASEVDRLVYLGASPLEVTVKYPRAYDYDGNPVWEAEETANVFEIDTKNGVLYASYFPVVTHKRLEPGDGTVLWSEGLFGGAGSSGLIQAVGPGNRLYVPSDKLYVYELDGTRSETTFFTAVWGAIVDVQITQDGRWLLGGIGNLSPGYVELLAANGAQLLALQFEDTLVNAVALDPDENLWIGVGTKALKYSQDGELLAEFDHGAAVWALSCDLDGNVYLCGNPAE